MTAIEKYRETLRLLIEKYKPRRVLEIGVEKGVSTKIFLETDIHECEVISIDIENCRRHVGPSDGWTFIEGDASRILTSDRVFELGGAFDLIFLDALYTKKRLEHDVPVCWSLLNNGGVLVFNEYIDFANHRRGQVRNFVHEWAFEKNLDFHVYPLRNGFAVVEKK